MAGGRPGIYFNEHVDGSCQSEDVVQVDVVAFPHGPSVSQVLELKSETSGVAATSVTKRAHCCLLVLCPTERGG